MTGPTREEVEEWVREAMRLASEEESPFGAPGTTEVRFRNHFAALAFAAGSRSGEDARDAALDLSRVTRLEVIDHSVAGTGRDLVRYGVRVSLLLQDDGRTLKVRLDAAMGGK